MNRTLLVLMATSGTAFAGQSVISSTVQQDFTIAYEKPSGEPATANLSRGSSQVGNTSVSVPDKGSTNVTVNDATGAVVATGKVVDDGFYVLMPKGDGFVLTQAGTRTGPWQPYPGVVIVNTLPDAYTIDIFGDSGKVGLKNQKTSKALDVKSAIKLAAGDDRFKVVIHAADGSVVETEGARASLGWYHVIHKAYNDKIVISNLGWMAPAKPEKAAQPAKKGKR